MENTGRRPMLKHPSSKSLAAIPGSPRRAPPPTLIRGMLVIRRSSRRLQGGQTFENTLIETTLVDDLRLGNIVSW
jgi:hypothetical protein